jgi:hypothetical protein
MASRNFSNELLGIFLKGIQEILPADTLDLLEPGSNARSAFQIFQIIDREYAEFGYTGACGLFLRSGAAAFKYLVRSQGTVIGIDSLEFRLQPQRLRLTDGMDKIIRLLDTWKAAKISISHEGDDVEVTMRPAGSARQITSAIIWLHFVGGLFQEFLYWAGGGKQYPFQISPVETEAAVVIQLRLLPVD